MEDKSPWKGHYLQCGTLLRRDIFLHAMHQYHHQRMVMDSRLKGSKIRTILFPLLKRIFALGKV